MAGIKDKILNKVLGVISLHNRIKVKTDSHIHPSAKMVGVSISGLVEIGEGCKLVGPGISIKAQSKVKLGRFTSLNGPNMDIVAMINPVTIGSFCSIARNVNIQEFNHRHDGLTTYHIHRNLFKESRLKDVYSNGPIVIGNDVWIGAQCVVTSGAKIGNGAVIAANSVVAGEIPPFAIAAGSPAKVIKFRFSDERIKEIEAMQWWEWSVEKIRENKSLFS
jgi:virginiamycin A acetyltransferase